MEALEENRGLKEFAKDYRRWLRREHPSDATRSAIVLEALESAACRLGLRVPDELRLVAMAEAAGLRRAERKGLPRVSAALGKNPLGENASSTELPDESRRGTSADWLERRRRAAHEMGRVLDLLHAVETVGFRSGDKALRRTLGSYYTPSAVAASLVKRSLQAPFLERCREANALVGDPAMGAGAFLIEAVVGIVKARGGIEDAEERLAAIGRNLYGADVSQLATATAEAALWVLTGCSDPDGARLVTTDALDRCVWRPPSFDWVIGNPPWVAFQGRAAQKLAPQRRAEFRENYRAFRGYRTLHALFVERAAEVAPQGVVSLLLPSSLSDLEGYRAARECLMMSHRPCEPLLEYGEDAFQGVVQPCFGLVAEPRAGESEQDPGRPWLLEERANRHQISASAPPPEFLEQLTQMPSLPRECFGELGFQSNRRATRELFLRQRDPRAPFTFPLLEGRNVSSFSVSPPRLFMDSDPEKLREVGCRLRPLHDFARAKFLVRQTAAFTIAARHESGIAFRNSLIAGYEVDDCDPDLLVGLLNSCLYRAMHVRGQRDARQATFPQVKVSHLRRLPFPPPSVDGREEVRRVSAEMTATGLSDMLRGQLDDAVFRLFAVPPEEQIAIRRFLDERMPRALRV